jgi:hypothetical protein
MALIRILRANMSDIKIDIKIDEKLMMVSAHVILYAACDVGGLSQRSSRHDQRF